MAGAADKFTFRARGTPLFLLSLVCVHSTSVAQTDTTILTHVSIRDDAGVLVESNIYEKHRDNRTTFLRYIESGKTEDAQIECRRSTRLLARPVGDSHTDSEDMACHAKDKAEFSVLRHLVANNLHAALQVGSRTDDGTVVLPHVLSELGYFARPEQQQSLSEHRALEQALREERFDEAIEIFRESMSNDVFVSGPLARNFAIVFAERALGVDDGVQFSRRQGRVVMTDRLLEAVQEFQNENHLANTGALNYPTLSALSGKTSAQLYYEPVAPNRQQ